MQKKRGQTSMEFLILFGFVFLMIIPLVVIFYTQSYETKDALNSNQIRNVETKIADKAESVYYLGEPSKSTLKAYFPDNVVNITIRGREIMFFYRTNSNTIQEILVTAPVNMTGNLSILSGIHYIIIQNRGDLVSITES
jgi:uncharacterized protein (UPF0333 family)